MIGCERLCGDCTACGALVWALCSPNPLNEAERSRSCVFVVGARPSYEDLCATPKQKTAAVILDPSVLVELLARALRGRGVDATVECNRGVQYRIVYYIGGVRMWIATNHGNSAVIPSARAALSRLLAAGLCGPEEALRLLEEPSQ